MCIRDREGGGAAEDTWHLHHRRACQSMPECTHARHAAPSRPRERRAVRSRPFCDYICDYILRLHFAITFLRLHFAIEFCITTARDISGVDRGWFEWELGTPRGGGGASVVSRPFASFGVHPSRSIVP
eukprot:6622188-Prymnesium_polylepis.1